MTNRPRSHILEDLSRAEIHRFFSKAGWTCEDLANDYGEDLLVRVFEGGKATPWKFFVQCKATDDLQRLLDHTRRFACIRLSRELLENWGAITDPVIVTLYDASTRKTYWTVVRFSRWEHLRRRRRNTSKTRMVRVPLDSRLASPALRVMRETAKAYHESHSTDLAHFSGLLKSIGEHWGVKLEHDHSHQLLMIPHGQFQADPSGDCHVIMYGSMLDKVQWMSRRMRKSPDEVFSEAIKALYRKFKRVQSGQPVSVKRADGTTQVIRSMDEFRDHMLEDEHATVR